MPGGDGLGVREYNRPLLYFLNHGWLRVSDRIRYWLPWEAGMRDINPPAKTLSPAPDRGPEPNMPPGVMQQDGQ